MPRLMAHDRTRWPLYLAIVKDSRTQFEIAADVGRSAAWLSRVMHGIVDPQPADKARVAGALGLPESELFPQTDNRAPVVSPDRALMETAD